MIKMLTEQQHALLVNFLKPRCSFLNGGHFTILASDINDYVLPASESTIIIEHEPDEYHKKKWKEKFTYLDNPSGEVPYEAIENAAKVFGFKVRESVTKMGEDIYVFDRRVI